MLGQHCRHQTGRGQSAPLGKVLTGRHSFRRRHSTGLLPIGNKDTVSRHVHRELNPGVPRCLVSCAPPRRLRQCPDYAWEPKTNSLIKDKPVHSYLTRVPQRTSVVESEWAGASLAQRLFLGPAAAGSHLWVHMGRWSTASRHGQLRLSWGVQAFGQTKTLMSDCQCSTCSLAEKLCEQLGGVTAYYYITEH